MRVRDLCMIASENDCLCAYDCSMRSWFVFVHVCVCCVYVLCL